MGNLFCSEYRIHKRFDLKGSSHGRTTDKPEGEIDETTTLKDLDLNFVFRLERSLQDFTVLPTEKFRRSVIRSSSVIFLPTLSPTEYFRRLYLRR